MTLTACSPTSSPASTNASVCHHSTQRPHIASWTELVSNVVKLPPGGLAHQAATAPSTLTGSSAWRSIYSKPIRFLPPFSGRQRSLSLSGSLCQMLWKLPPGGLAHQAATAPSTLTGNSAKIPSSNRAPSISKPIRFLPPFSGRQRSLSLSDTLNTRALASSSVEWRPSSTSQR